MDMRHEITVDLKRVTQELGYVPTRDDYLKHGRFKRPHIDKTFGTYTIALTAAGLKVSKKERNRKLKELFLKDIEQEIPKHKSKPILTNRGNFKDIVVIGDTHFPFVCEETLTFIYDFIDAVKPKRCVQIGDLYDLYSHGRFPRSHNVYMPNQEIELAQKQAAEMWLTIQKLSPGIECYQLRGNHDIRPLRKIQEHYPEGEIFFSIDKWFEFDGVKDVGCFRKELILDDIVFHHGYSSRLGAHKEHNLMNTVVGHSHKGGVVYRSLSQGRVLWELNAGYCGDPESKALSYTPQKIVKWTKGFGYVDCYGPRFIPIPC